MMEDSVDSSLMENLPDLILLNIFSYLDFTDLCICSRVCRRWYKLTHSLSLRRKIFVTRHIMERKFPCLVEYHFHKDLEEFHFLNSSQSQVVHITRETFFNLRTKCPGLKKLVLMCCGLNCVSVQDMPSNLRHLSIRNCELNPYHFFTTRPQKFIPYLTCLDVSGISNFLTSEDLHVFTPLKNLRCLCFEGCFRVNNGGIESIVDIIRHLEVLDVEGTDISNEGALTIINNGAVLKELYIGYVNIGDCVFHTVYMDMFLRLKSLCVKDTNITSMTVKKFKESSSKKLNFSSNFDEDGNLVDREKSALNRYLGCNHFRSHSCSS